ncbi:MAG: hemerythrin domain-containing protein [Armatimonadota bacterium]
MLNDPFQTAPTFDDPLGMLRACHRRIEAALTRLGRVVELEREGELPEPARTALRQVLDYFAIGVPRHSADEDESLFPRLRSELAGEAVATIAEEHAALETLHHELDRIGRRLVETGRCANAAERERLGELADRLQAIYGGHIRREDEELFPLAERTVAAEVLQEVGAEMAARRGIDWSEQREIVAKLHSRPWTDPTRFAPRDDDR